VLLTVITTIHAHLCGLWIVFVETQNSPIMAPTNEGVVLPLMIQPASDTTVIVRFGEEKSDDNASLPQPRFAVAYWSMRGLGAPLRMMLCAARTDFVCHLYDSVEDTDSETAWKSSYFTDKESFLARQPFMNLPFVIDEQENMLVTQTNACFQYLGEHLGLMGQTLAERTLCAMLLSETTDLRNNMVQFAYRGAPDKAASTVETAQKHFAKFNRHFQNKMASDGDNGSTTPLFCVGDSFTAPDFHLFEMIDQYDVLCQTYGLEDCLGERFPHVRNFYKSFSELE
jgi:glutathione S-transferase